MSDSLVIDIEIQNDKEFLSYWNHPHNCEPETQNGIFDFCNPEEIRNIYAGWKAHRKYATEPNKYS